jgi:hypothetical protein
MNGSRFLKTLALAGFILWSATPQAQTIAPYQNDFEKAEVGSTPEEFLVLDGEFQVKEESGNKFLELPGAPLETYGFLFGPTAKENLTASARFFGTAKGRRFPTFAIGLCGAGGYKLRVAPAKNALELLKGDEIKQTVSLKWESAKWTHLEISAKKGASDLTLTGKVWQEGAKAPAEPTISWVDPTPDKNGRALIQASPYAGTPIRFDDLEVEPAK